MRTVYPCVPGHEIVGRVISVGSSVVRFKASGIVGVGCLVDSDHSCPNCQAGLKQFCGAGATKNTPRSAAAAVRRFPLFSGGFLLTSRLESELTIRTPPIRRIPVIITPSNAPSASKSRSGFNSSRSPAYFPLKYCFVIEIRSPFVIYPALLNKG